MALLTPDDVREHVFPTVHLKTGYDMEEVDDFLDEVTSTIEALSTQAVQSGSTQSFGPEIAQLNEKISQLSTENEQLRSQVAAAEQNPVDQGQVQALTSQNEQLKMQVDQLNQQVDQLTAQSAQIAQQSAAAGDEVASQVWRRECSQCCPRRSR